MGDLDLLKKFIDKSPDFWNDLSLTDVDPKHENVINKFSNNFDYNKFLREIRSWEMQDDGPIPFQLNTFNIKKNNPKKNLTLLLKKIISKFKKYDLTISLRDDIEILKQIGAYDLLKDNPVHLSPYVDSAYFLSQNLSTNYRWNKYIYYAHTILNKKLFKNEGIWIDIGSFYGGLQGILAKYYDNFQIVLIDFHHQLCRSYLYLNKLYPNAKHIIADEHKTLDSVFSTKDSRFVYLSINNLHKINEIKPFLITNMFSLGEMTRNTFNQYCESPFMINAKYLYLVNRFVSSPFFENTYKNDINIFDYKFDNFERLYFDVFPINHYQTPYRNLFGRNAARPVSSSYFEMIFKNII